MRKWNRDIGTRIRTIRIDKDTITYTLLLRGTGLTWVLLRAVSTYLFLLDEVYQLPGVN